MFELFAEDIGVDLFVYDPDRAAAQSLAQTLFEMINAIDDRRSGVEKQASAGRKAINALLDDVQAQRGAEFTAAMAIKPCERIDEIRRIGDDQVERATHIRVQ